MAVNIKNCVKLAPIPEFEPNYLSNYTHWEKDGAPSPIMPNEVRLRNLTYVHQIMYSVMFVADLSI